VLSAFRAVEDSLGLEEVYVLGTNCADNSPTSEAAQNFIRNGVKLNTDQSKVQGYEFMQDFKVHVKSDDSYITKPYFTLPGTIAEASIAPSCLSCFDYTNGLADVVVGYMGAPLDANARMDQSYQTLTIRNEKGGRMIQAALDTSRIALGEQAFGSGSHEKLAVATVGSDSIILKMVGKPVPEQGMPVWLGEIMAFAMRNIGPKGINFARYSIDYHILRNYLHVLDSWGEERSQTCLPAYARQIVAHYVESDRVMKQLADTVASKRIS
jgi:Coenzyme F420 hydrogenase/dehydrogenase, beta subunit C terminus